MDRDNPCDTHKADKLFQLHQIVIASLFGTALAGILALAFNYRVLKIKNGYIVTMVSIALILPAYVVTFVNLRSSSYDRFFPVLIAILLGLVGAALQKKLIANAIENGAERNTKWRLFLLIVVGLIGTLSLLFFMQLAGFLSLPS